MTIQRLLRAPERSFFLFGARGTGKSTWLRQAFPDALVLDLLNTELQLELLAHPHRLEALVGARPDGAWIVLDEVQKLPVLLDEVHRLMEARRWRFALCGSSARKLKRGAANLLAGRAITLTMEPFCSAELGAAFSLAAALEWGLLPVVHGAGKDAPDVLAAYASTYLNEEIKAEGVVRGLAAFARFLAIAGQLNGQVLNMQNVAREAALPRSSVEGYFEILTDTLVGVRLPAYRPGLKVREAAHPKFYWVDVGMARAAAGMLRDPVDRAWLGVALETLVFHELRVYNAVYSRHRPIAYYRTAAGLEVDFIVETQRRSQTDPGRVVCIEVKAAPRWDDRWGRAMRDMAAAGKPRVERMIGVYTGEREYHMDGVDVWPIQTFLSRLHAGDVF